MNRPVDVVQLRRVNPSGCIQRLFHPFLRFMDHAVGDDGIDDKPDQNPRRKGDQDKDQCHSF